MKCLVASKAKQGEVAKNCAMCVCDNFKSNWLLWKGGRG